MILHPKYDAAKNHDYDFALLKLDRKVTFTDRVRPACLPEHTTSFPIGTECYISGWGLLKEYGAGPAVCFIYDFLVKRDKFNLLFYRPDRPCFC